MRKPPSPGHSGAFLGASLALLPPPLTLTLQGRQGSQGLEG